MVPHHHVTVANPRLIQTLIQIRVQTKVQNSNLPNMKTKMFKVWQKIPGYFSCWNQPILDSQSALGILFSGPTIIKLAFLVSKNG